MESPTLFELVPVLRNARRRLLHGMSPDLLHALHQATRDSDALYRGCAQVIYFEAAMNGGFTAVDASVEEMTAMFVAWVNRTGASAAAGVMQRCIDRIEAELRAP